MYRPRCCLRRPSLLLQLLTCAVLAAAAARADDVSLPSLSLSQAQTQAAGIQLQAVQAVRSAAVDDTGGIRLSGRAVVPGDNSGIILSAVAGQVATVLVQPGAEVRSGQPLARIYSAELATLQREYLHAKAEAGVASSRHQRDVALFKDGIIAEARLRETSAALEVANATQQEQRRALLIAGFSEAELGRLTAASISAEVTVHARIAGVVLEQPVAGERVEPGATLFRIAPTGHWWLELNASLQQAGELSIGDQVGVVGCEAQGRIIAVGTRLSTASQTVAVRAEISEAAACLKSNQYIEASIAPTTVPAGLVSVPASAIVRNGEREFVFVKQDERFTPVPVTVQRRLGQQVWLKDGPAAGTDVASAGIAALKGAWLGLGAVLATDDAG